MAFKKALIIPYAADTLAIADNATLRGVDTHRSLTGVLMFTNGFLPTRRIRCRFKKPV